jgi:hypothetical protein
MSRKKMILGIGIVAWAMTMLVSQALSQEPPQQPRGRQRGPAMNQGDQGDAAAQPPRPRQGDRVKTELGVSDEEWKDLQPKIQKVNTLNRELRTPPGMGMAGRGGRGGQGAAGEAQSRPGAPATAGEGGPMRGTPQAPPTELQERQQALRTALDNPEARPEEIRTALRAYRDARAKVRSDLEQAQKDLRKSVNERQEAQLVMMGILD